jgi:hypothetical protein
MEPNNPPITLTEFRAWVQLMRTTTLARLTNGRFKDSAGGVCALGLLATLRGPGGAPWPAYRTLGVFAVYDWIRDTAGGFNVIDFNDNNPTLSWLAIADKLESLEPVLFPVVTRMKELNND